MGETFSELDVRMELGEAILQAGSQRKFARQLGVSDSFVSMMVRGEKGIPNRVLEAIGFRRVTRYEPIPSPPSQDREPGGQRGAK